MVELLVATLNGVCGALIILGLAMRDDCLQVPTVYRLGMWVGATGLVCQCVVHWTTGAPLDGAGGNPLQVWVLTDAGYWIVGAAFLWRQWRLRHVPKPKLGVAHSR